MYGAFEIVNNNLGRHILQNEIIYERVDKEKTYKKHFFFWENIPKKIFYFQYHHFDTTG